MKSLSKTILFFILLACCLPCCLQGREWAALFGSVDCDDCNALKAEWQERYEMPEGPVLIFLAIENMANYRLLHAFENKLNIEKRSTSFPLIFHQGRFYSNLEEFEQRPQTPVEGLEKLAEYAELAQVAEKAEAVLVRYDYRKLEETQEAITVNIPELLLFYQKNCAKCSRQELELADLSQKIASLNIARYDVATMEGRAMLGRFYTNFKLKETNENMAPTVCYPDGYIHGRLATADELATALVKAKGEPFWKKPLEDRELKLAKARSEAALGGLIFLSVITAGLLDGINPCAFATSLFLISYLLMKKRRSRDIAVVGFSFCFGVFIAYILFGLGMSFLIDLLGRLTWIKTALYSIFGCISLVLAIWSVRDGIVVRRTGKVENMDLGLSHNTHKGIHEMIRKFTEKSSWLMFPAAFVLGCIVSSMELACTGQIYLPVIAAINSSGIQLRSLLLLLLYNVCFILPLVAITILAYKGGGVKAVAEWARTHVAGTKFAMAALFALIALLMFGIVLHA